MQQVVRRIGRRHPTRLARIGANALRAPADNALGQKILHHLGGRSGGVGASFVGVQEQVFVMRALVPVGSQDHPLTRPDRAMLVLPRLNVVNGPGFSLHSLAKSRTLTGATRRWTGKVSV